MLLRLVSTVLLVSVLTTLATDHEQIPLNFDANASARLKTHHDPRFAHVKRVAVIGAGIYQLILHLVTLSDGL